MRLYVLDAALRVAPAAWPASCAWQALVPHADMLTGPDSPPSGSPRIPSARPEAGCTAPAMAFASLVWRVAA
jgi:hypothetical protein